MEEKIREIKLGFPGFLSDSYSIYTWGTKWVLGVNPGYPITSPIHPKFGGQFSQSVTGLCCNIYIKNG